MTHVVRKRSCRYEKRVSFLNTELRLTYHQESICRWCWRAQSRYEYTDALVMLGKHVNNHLLYDVQIFFTDIAMLGEMVFVKLSGYIVCQETEYICSRV